MNLGITVDVVDHRHAVRVGATRRARREVVAVGGARDALVRVAAPIVPRVADEASARGEAVVLRASLLAVDGLARRVVGVAVVGRLADDVVGVVAEEPLAAKKRGRERGRESGRSDVSHEATMLR